MTGPKHLWSGNWEQESPDPPRQAIPPRPERAEWAPSRAPVTPPRSRRGLRSRARLAAPLLTAAAVVAVVLVVLATTGGSPSHKPASRASAPSVTVPNLGQPSPITPTPSTPGRAGAGSTTPATAVTGHTINWLGMQIATVQGTGAVVQTVQLGTPADAAGLDPGDVIQTVNGHPIAWAKQIAAALRGLSQGEPVSVSVERGSTQFTTAVPFQGPPTSSP